MKTLILSLLLICFLTNAKGVESKQVVDIRKATQSPKKATILSNAELLKTANKTISQKNKEISKLKKRIKSLKQSNKRIARILASHKGRSYTIGNNSSRKNQYKAHNAVLKSYITSRKAYKKKLGSKSKDTGLYRELKLAKDTIGKNARKAKIRKVNYEISDVKFQIKKLNKKINKMGGYRK